MFDVGWSEATVILLLALLLFGPDKLADFAKTLGRLYGEYKTARRRLELELLYGKEIVDREYIRDLAKLKLENPGLADFSRIVDFSTTNLNPEFRRRVLEGDYPAVGREEDFKVVEDDGGKVTESEESGRKAENGEKSEEKSESEV